MKYIRPLQEFCPNLE